MGWSSACRKASIRRWPSIGDYRPRSVGAGDDLTILPNAETDAFVSEFDQQVRIEHDFLALQFADDERGIRHMMVKRTRDPGDWLRNGAAAEEIGRHQSLLPL